MEKTRLLLVLLICSACVTQPTRPLLVIASDATFAPFHLLDATGEPTGFDIELARAVVLHAGFEPKVVVLDYAELFSGLAAGTHDVVAATTGITDERKLQYRFSRPYFSTCQVAVVRTGRLEPRIATELRGRRIGAAGDGTSARAMHAIDGVHVRINDGEGIGSLLQQTIDAWIVDEFDGVLAARGSDGRLQVLRQGVAGEEYGFVLAEDRVDLQQKLNASLQSLASDGTLDTLSRQFGLHRADDWPVECTRQ